MVKQTCFFLSFLTGQEEAQTSQVDKGILNNSHFIDYRNLGNFRANFFVI